jgi:hypothetical protein
VDRAARDAVLVEVLVEVDLVDVRQLTPLVEGLAPLSLNVNGSGAPCWRTRPSPDVLADSVISRFLPPSSSSSWLTCQS